MAASPSSGVFPTPPSKSSTNSATSLPGVSASTSLMMTLVATGCAVVKAKLWSAAISSGGSVGSVSVI